MDALINFATSGLDCAVAIARFAYCTAVLAAEGGKVAYQAGKAARAIHEDGKAWVESRFPTLSMPQFPLPQFSIRVPQFSIRVPQFSIRVPQFSIRDLWHGIINGIITIPVKPAATAIPLLTGTRIAGYLPEAAPRVLITPFVARSHRVLITPNPVAGYLPAVSSAPRYTPAVVADVVTQSNRPRFGAALVGAIAAAISMTAMPSHATPADVIEVPAIEVVEDMGIRELRKLARKAGIKGYSRKSKTQLMQELAA